MSELQKAIEEITYYSKIFPAQAFQTVKEHRDEAVPYLRSAIEKAIEEQDMLDEGYQLYFYALFFLGEFQDRESFPLILEFVTLPDEILDDLLGDAITSGLNDIVYNTYNGDLELLKTAVMNEDVNEYVRSALLDVMGQLYLDGALEEKEWREFLRKCVYKEEEYSYFFNAVGSTICQCHLADMLPEIRYLLDEELMDLMCMGDYDSCVDEMFVYREANQRFCKDSIDTAKTLKSWAMFEDTSDPAEKEKQRKDFEKSMKEMKQKEKQKHQIAALKIGRNDPCPCGSGKKYKFCCLNKPKSPLDTIESEQDRQKCLDRYPYIGKERLENRVYLQDYFDAESIEIDKLLYLGLSDRPMFIWLRDDRQIETRCREYLKLAFPMFVDKVKKEEIKTFQEYDEKYSIHYFCEDWFGRLLYLLERNGEKALYNEVKKCRRAMS